MAYDFYIGSMLLPVPPEKLTVKINNGNKIYNLMNEGEINVLKTPGLTEIDFDVLLPNVQYPFAVYKNGFQRAEVYLEELERLKSKKKSFQFIVSRVLPDGTPLFDTNIKCSIEDYSIKEDAGNDGMDVTVSISLKQYRSYGVKKCKVKTKKSLNLKKLRNKKWFNLPKGSDEFIMVAKIEGQAETTQIVIKKAITLYNLAKKIYGDGSLYTIIAKANYTPTKKEKISGKKTSLWKKSKKLKKGKKVNIPLTYYS